MCAVEYLKHLEGLVQENSPLLNSFYKSKDEVVEIASTHFNDIIYTKVIEKDQGFSEFKIHLTDSDQNI
jgi:hypothetical protein